MSGSLRILRRIEKRLLDASLVDASLEVSEMILVVEGVRVEHPTPEEDILRICEELDEEGVNAQNAQDAVGAQALLIEVVKRAAFDWVLYRGSSRLEQKKIAEDAYTWIFLEDEDHPNWEVRTKDDKQITSFISICDVFDIDPEGLRRKIRKLDPQRVLVSGRPPGTGGEDVHGREMYSHVEIPSVDTEESFLSFL